jgi:hypothetical protein
MNFQILKKLLSDCGCLNIYIKELAPNDNSKNQVYFGGSFDILNIFPLVDIKSYTANSSKDENFKASLNFYWITEDQEFVRANNAQLILYPQYPEVRFSGFLKNCIKAPSKLMTSRSPERILFLAVTADGRILGYVIDKTFELYNEYLNFPQLTTHGVFYIIDIISQNNNRSILLKELIRIHQLGWINSKRLGSHGEVLPCLSPNCGGYTLEAELGVRPNGFSEPDFLGWEIKQFNARNFEKIGSEILTLMTPEPTGGYYVNEGVEEFVRKYGYPDKLGRYDRLNFGGIHKIGLRHPLTNLKLQLIGFDRDTNKIVTSNGRISLVDSSENEAASWSFATLLLHWNRKHNLACYVPSHKKNETQLQYRYGANLILGIGTNFIRFLDQMSKGNIYYDPGIKVEDSSTNPHTKRRSQFRIKSAYINSLYNKSEFINILDKDYMK